MKPHGNTGCGVPNRFVLAAAAAAAAAAATLMEGVQIVRPSAPCRRDHPVASSEEASVTPQVST